jgi:hypothetical protein
MRRYADDRVISTDSVSHSHVSVFHGPSARFCPGLVVVALTPEAWEVRDQTGQIGAPGTAYGTWASEREACREALRLLRAKLGAPTFPCWGAGAPNRALTDLGYTRGRLQWRWWPPGLTRTDELPVGPNGMPEKL